MRVIGLVLLLLVPSALPAQDLGGSTVSAIEIEGAPVSALDDLPLRVGDLLSTDRVRASIQHLYSEWQFGRIVVDATDDSSGGVRVVFRVDEAYFFATVRVSPDKILERPLSSYVSLPYGRRFSRTRLDEIVAVVEAQLLAEGYFGAGVRPNYELDDQARLATVTVQVEAGSPARVRNVRFEGGSETFSDQELEDAFDVRPGVRFRADTLTEGAERLRAEFAELGFLDTRIVLGEPAYDANTGEVDLTVLITPGPFVLVQVRGYELSTSRMRELVPIFEEASVDSDLIDESVANMLEYLRREGYFEATVGFEFIESQVNPGFFQLNFTVEPGTRFSVGEVRIEGNTAFTDEEIYAQIGISKKGLFSRGVFSPELLEDAVSNIVDMYLTEGFSGTRVTPIESTLRNTKTLVLEIEEGDQLVVTALSFSGNTALGEEALILMGGMRPGQDYRPALVEAARRAIASGYHQEGYPDVRVNAAVESDELGGVDIAYQITEGTRRGVRRILVAGNTRTRDTVVRRNSNLEEFVPYNPETILEAQRNLYATGLFNRVDIVPLEGSQEERDVLIQVEDAGPLLLTYGVGVQEGVGPRGTFEVSHTNLWGLDRSIRFQVRGGVREQSLQTTYREPRLFNWDLDGFASTFIERTDQPAFEASRIDFSIQTLKQFQNRDSLLLSASYQTVNLKDIRVNPRAPDFPDEVGVIQIARVGSSYVRDSRDDPISPTRGNYFTGTFQVANKAFGSEVNFTSLFTQASIFRPAREAVLAASLRIGWNQPYGSTDSLPITERYFAGGSTTLRSFGLDEAGALTGGHALMLLNAEYRYPIPFPLPGLGGTLFYDTGTVFPRISDFNVGDFTHTLGLGIRYQTPLGPIRLDFGFNVNRQPTEGANHVFFTLGHAF